MQRFNVIFFTYLTISVIGINITSTKKLTSQPLKANVMGGMCMKGLMVSMPPSFCWKRGGDVGVIPTGCPSGYFRNLALCLEYCAPGYAWDGALLCLSTCPSGYETHPLTCYKGIFDWFSRKSYFTNSITNFSPLIPCPEGMYREGALCYRDCNIIGMVNCGIGACAVDTSACVSGVVNIIFNWVGALIDSLNKVVINDMSALADLKSTVRQSVNSAGHSKVYNAARAAIVSVKGNFKNIFINKSIRNTQDFMWGQTSEDLNDTKIYISCMILAQSAIYQTSNNVPNFDADRIVSSVDFFGNRYDNQNCKKETTDLDGGASCVRGILNTADNFDPTSLLTIGSLFASDVCDIPVRLDVPYLNQNLYNYYKSSKSTPITPITPTNDPEEEMNGTIPSGCVQFWKDPNFTGESRIYCNLAVSEMLGFDNELSSFKIGPKTTMQLYDHVNFQGENWLVEDGDEVNMHKQGWDNKISSLKVAKDSDRAVVYEHSNQQGQRMYLKGEINGLIEDADVDSYLSAKIGKRVKLVLYEGSYFKGSYKEYLGDDSKFYNFHHNVASLKVE